MDARTGTAVIFLAILVGGLIWIAQIPPSVAESGTFVVYVVAPDGALFANGTVEVAAASAQSILVALSNQLNFPVNIEERAGFSGCSSSYVLGIGPYQESPSGGWNFYVREPGQSWQWQSYGAGCPIPRGVEVEWCWVEHDACRHHVA